MSAVQVYIAKDEMEAHLIKGLLEDAGIKSVLSTESSSDTLLVHVPNQVYSRYGVYVEEGKAEEAKKILAER